jgi:hypothetical protein
MEADVAPVMLQLNVELPPGLIVAGSTINKTMVGRLPGLTVTVACAVTDPFAFVAVRV